MPQRGQCGSLRQRLNNGNAVHRSFPNTVPKCLKSPLGKKDLCYSFTVLRVLFFCFALDFIFFIDFVI